jgi:hypothetical protein
MLSERDGGLLGTFGDDRHVRVQRQQGVHLLVEPIWQFQATIRIGPHPEPELCQPIDFFRLGHLTIDMLYLPETKLSNALDG